MRLCDEFPIVVCLACSGRVLNERAEKFMRQRCRAVIADDKLYRVRCGARAQHIDRLGETFLRDKKFRSIFRVHRAEHRHGFSRGCCFIEQ